MLTRIRLILFLLFIALCSQPLFSQSSDEKTIEDINFRFTLKLPGNWDTKDLKQTTDKDGISYSLERNDNKMTMMILAFKLSSVKNLEDFIYNLEKDINLNIPPKTGTEYNEKDFGNYDMKSGIYKDDKFAEIIYYYRTKLPDSPHNYVYMLRFIMNSSGYNSDSEAHVKSIIDTFKPTAE